MLVEPVRLVSCGLKHLLLDSCYDVVEERHAAAASLALDDGPLPDLVVFGPGAHPEAGMGKVWIQQQRSKPRRSRIVAFADTADTGLVRLLASSGVDAVLSQDVSREVLGRSLDLVMLGQQLFPPVPSHLPHEATLRTDIGIARALAPVLASATAGLMMPGRERKIALSQREGQVLQLLSNGASNKAIARELHITETTVKTHVKCLLRKIRANNRTQAAIWALENNMQTPGASGSAPVLAQSPVLAQTDMASQFIQM